MITKYHQSPLSLSGALADHDVESSPSRVRAVRIDVSQNEREAPEHQHRKGQLVMPLLGGGSCSSIMKIQTPTGFKDEV